MKKLLLPCLLLLAGNIFATHNRAGEITYKWLGGLSYEVRITTYTRACGLCADRCKLVINWGDGDSEELNRINGPSNRCPDAADGVVIDPVNEIRKNIYIGTHTYDAPGIYTLFMEDANRNAGISNIVNSDQVPFYIQSEIFIAPALGGNSSPILTNPPVERGCINKRFEHSPGAFDPDGDSLSYKLVLSRTVNGDPIPTIYDPTLVQDSVKIDPTTGLFVWDVPQNPGQYNFAFEITEWRKNSNGRYTKIGYVTRDMQVDIEDCGNNPPQIQPVGPFCIEAGKQLRFKVRAVDVDGDDITLTAFGGPFEVQDSANPFFFQGFEPVTGTFIWNTTCNNVRRAPYQVTFKAEDDPDDAFEIPLTDLYTTEIRVLAPAPKNPSAQGEGRQIKLRWDPEVCTDAIGYKIYRREALFGFVPDSCENDVPAYTGYELIDSARGGLFDTSYVDNDPELKLGVQYCYMVAAYFPDEAVSFASSEFCASLPLSLPLMTKADVQNTTTTTGRINVNWIAPPVLDSTLNPPPYRYVLFRADSINGLNYTELATLDGLNNTGFVDSLRNTQDLGHRYRVDFRSGSNFDLVGTADAASTVYLKTKGVDRAVELNMTNNTPWLNYRYVILRENPTGSGVFDSIAESYTDFYRDTGLVNGEEYCYRVEAYGRYTANDSLPAPLFNRSQENCAFARDTIAPCAPLFSLRTVCPDTVYFSWRTPAGCANDVVEYRIYYKPAGGVFDNNPVLSIPASGDSTIKFVNDGDLFGCYAITAVDDAGNDPGGQPNESPLSEEVCLESCFQIRFPNVFTPNGDGVNDFFLPYEFNQLRNLRIQIFNRWGSPVYEANTLEQFVNPGWDGTVQQTGNPATAGVYFYVCYYTPDILEPTREQKATGFIHLFR